MYLISDEKLKKNCSLTPNEWAIVSDVLFLLKPMADATNFMSTSKYASLSSTLPVYTALMEVKILIGPVLFIFFKS